MAKKRRNNNGYQYQIRNGEWFVVVRGVNRRRDVEEGPFPGRDEAQAFVRQHAEDKGNGKFVHPSKVQVTVRNDPKLSNDIPGAATIKVDHRRIKRIESRANRDQHRAFRQEKGKKFDQKWAEGIKQFLDLSVIAA
jgi:hypothetical protein